MYCFGFQFSFYILWSNYIYWNGDVRLRINNVWFAIPKTVNPIQSKISDMAHNKEPIAKTVETEADHVSHSQLSDESDSDDDIVTHVVYDVQLSHVSVLLDSEYHLSDCQPHHLPHSHF
jgi:hypothetical protein